MSKIGSVEVLQVDLAPKVKRSDAIQSFQCQETPMVRVCRPPRGTFPQIIYSPTDDLLRVKVTWCW
jgi:hypothetical protein